MESLLPTKPIRLHSLVATSQPQAPDTCEHFCQYSLDAVIAEMKSLAPDLYHLFMQLGKTSRNVESHETSTEQIEAVMSLCALLNARSMRVKGIQLLLSLMLMARSTNRQVSYMPTSNSISTTSV